MDAWLELSRALEMPFLGVFIKPDFSDLVVRDAFEGNRILLRLVKPFPK